MSKDTMNFYAARDIMSLDREGGHYSRHVAAMTAEDLHEKSEIAAELAFRDFRIDALEWLLIVKEVTALDMDQMTYDGFREFRAIRNKALRDAGMGG